MADQTLQFIITAQNNAKQAFNEAKNQLKDFEKETKDVSDTIKKMTAGFAVVGAAVRAFGVSSIKAAADIETQKIGFQTLLGSMAVSYTHLRAHETVLDLVCRLLLEKKKRKKQTI